MTQPNPEHCQKSAVNKKLRRRHVPIRRLMLWASRPTDHGRLVHRLPSVSIHVRRDTAKLPSNISYTYHIKQLSNMPHLHIHNVLVGGITDICVILSFSQFSTSMFLSLLYKLQCICQYFLKKLLIAWLKITCKMPHLYNGRRFAGKCWIPLSFM